MSVVGIDFGDESSYVAVARAGGIETVDNDYSLRATPSFVAFGGKQRILGVAAKNQQVTNLKNTIFGFKRFIGRKFDDPWIQSEAQRLPFAIGETKSGEVGINVNYLGEQQTYSAQQITAMLLSKLKETTESAINNVVHDCVVSCPSFFTNAERQGLLDACAMSGLNVLRLLNDTAATALTYGIYKQDLPAEEEPPKNVVFVDCGHSALQVFACAFNKGKLKILSTTFDATLGGRNFTAVIATHFCDEFSTKYGIDPRKNHRAYIRLVTEVEKLKKQMSANSTKLPFNIECLMDDKDVSSYLSRSDYEAMAEPLFKRVETCLRACLDTSGLKLDQIHSVEIVGGASRTPAIKQLIENVFKMAPSTTLNQDEAVARGCALMCAILSPAFKVREFSVTDVQQFPIKMVYDEAAGEKGEMEVYPQYHPIPFTKMLTFHRREPFTVKAYYNSKTPFPNPEIGTYTITNVKPTLLDENMKVKMKCKVNIHGIFGLVAAVGYERLENQPETSDANGNGAVNENQTQENSEETNATPTPDGSQTENQNQDENASPLKDNKDANDEKKPAPPKPKKQQPQYASIDLPVVAVNVGGYTRAELDRLIETEVSLVSQDRVEKDRIDAKNALEEYVYDLREKLEGELREFLKDEERVSLIQKLNSDENWLYEEGSDDKKSTYIQRLEDLKKLGEPVKIRKREFDEVPSALQNLSLAITRARKVMDAVKSNDPSYNHLETNEIKKLGQEIDSTTAWFDNAWGKIQSARKDTPPPVLSTDVSQKNETFHSVISPIINKSKPAPPPPPKEEPMDSTPKEADKPQENSNPPPPQDEKSQPDASMEVE
jgi:heat shock protein